MFTWNEQVALGLINILEDPELVIHFMRVLKPLRRDLIEEKAREWHKSQRTTKEERWERISDLSKRRKFSQMNASVPITCTLPFNGEMWRTSILLLKSIRYFREGFLRTGHAFALDPLFASQGMSDSQKIRTVNLMMSETITGQNFRSSWTREDIREALDDFILFEEDQRTDDEEKPFILVEELRINGDLKPIMDIIG